MEVRYYPDCEFKYEITLSKQKLNELTKFVFDEEHVIDIKTAIQFTKTTMYRKPSVEVEKFFLDNNLIEERDYRCYVYAGHFTFKSKNMAMKFKLTFS